MPCSGYIAMPMLAEECTESSPRSNGFVHRLREVRRDALGLPRPRAFEQDGELVAAEPHEEVVGAQP